MDSTVLEQLGVTSNAAHVYLALFNNGSSTATELSNLSGVPRGVIYRVLDELISKGLCVQKSGTVKKYAVTDPNLNLKGLIDIKRQELKSAESLQEELQERYSQVMSFERVPLEYIEILKDPKLINAKYLELVKGTRKEALVFVKAPYINQRVNRVQEQIQSQLDMLKKQNIKMRSIYNLDEFYELDSLEDHKDKEVRAYIRMLQSLHFSHKYGIKDIRVTPDVPLKAAVFDEKHLLFLLPDPVTQIFSVTSLHIQHKDLAASLKMLFEVIWKEALTWEEYLESHNAKSSYDVKLEDL